MKIKIEKYKITGVDFIDDFLSVVIFSIMYMIFVFLAIGSIALVCVGIGKLFS